MKRELRTCPVTGDVVLVNEAWPERARPAEVEARCWFCLDSGPAPTISLAHGTRCVPHPTPALGIEGASTIRRDGAGLARDAVGAHELLFPDRHEADASTGAADIALLRHARDRMADLRRDPRFRGFGLAREAAPLRHVSWSLLALPFDTRPTPALTWRDAELREGRRVITRAHGAVAIAAFAPKMAFETWVLPESGRAGFGEAGDNEGWTAVVALASRILARLLVVLGGPVVQLTLEDGEPWRLVLRPRLHREAPVDALGLPTVGVFPETAARVLRQS